MTKSGKKTKARKAAFAKEFIARVIASAAGRLIGDEASRAHLVERAQDLLQHIWNGISH